MLRFVAVPSCLLPNFCVKNIFQGFVYKSTNPFRFSYLPPFLKKERENDASPHEMLQETYDRVIIWKITSFEDSQKIK
jgi:hypothetical protein